MCVFVEGVGIRQQECVVMQGGFFFFHVEVASVQGCVSLAFYFLFYCFVLFFLALIFPSVQPLSVESKAEILVPPLLIYWHFW